MSVNIEVKLDIKAYMFQSLAMKLARIVLVDYS